MVLRAGFDGWAILLDPDTGEAFGLNPTGVFIWNLLDGRHSMDDIARKLRAEAQGVPDEVPLHIDDFVRGLEMQGLVGYEAGNPTGPEAR